MKSILSIVAGLILASAPAFAQGGPGPGPSTNDNNFNHSWSNYVNQSYEYQYLWGTNCLSLTNVPNAWSNNWSHSYAAQSAAGGGGQVQNRFGKPELPADVTTIVQKFQQDRTRLMSQLKTCSDEQRQQILKDMDQLRLQLRDQISKIRDDARDQAERMRNRFGNNRDVILDQGAGNAGTGRDR